MPVERGLRLSRGYARREKERQMGKVVRKSHSLGDCLGVGGMDGGDFTDKTVLRPGWLGEGRAEPEQGSIFVLLGALVPLPPSHLPSSLSGG